MESFIAESAVLKEIKQFITQIAQSSSALFLTGDFGTGKTFLAHYLHTLRNTSGTFISIPCAHPSFEKEGAIYAAFKKAQGGSIFFSEVHRLSPNAQKELREALSVNADLQGTDTFVYVCASSSAQIDVLIENGSFLPALYYELSDTVLHIPPLKERKEDILPLARSFLHKYENEVQKSFSDFSEAAKDALLKNVWKGNIHELKACIQYACIVGTEPCIELTDFPMLCATSPEDTTARVLEEHASASDKSLHSALLTFKKRYLEMILKETAWNQTEAAHILCVQRTYISKLMNSLNIHRP